MKKLLALCIVIILFQQIAYMQVQVKIKRACYISINPIINIKGKKYISNVIVFLLFLQPLKLNFEK
jgi:hypothetical protein